MTSNEIVIHAGLSVPIGPFSGSNQSLVVMKTLFKFDDDPVITEAMSIPVDSKMQKEIDKTV